MSHPQCCKSPETCDLSYVEHLRGVMLGAEAIPSRAVHRTPGLPDEPAVNVDRRQRQWDKDHRAYKTLRQQGYRPPSWRGAHQRAQTARTDAEVNG